MSLKIPTHKVKELREQSGAGIMDCRNALLEAEGDIEKALQILKERSLFQAQKKAERSATQGVIEAYIHTGGYIGAMVEVNCETDFVARTDEFKELAHHLAMQVAAICPQFVSKEEIPELVNLARAAGECMMKRPVFLKALSEHQFPVENIPIKELWKLCLICKFSGRCFE